VQQNVTEILKRGSCVVWRQRAQTCVQVLGTRACYKNVSVLLYYVSTSKYIKLSEQARAHTQHTNNANTCIQSAHTVIHKKGTNLHFHGLQLMFEGQAAVL
jgi:hypothetical protein